MPEAPKYNCARKMKNSSTTQLYFQYWSKTLNMEPKAPTTIDTKLLKLKEACYHHRSPQIWTELETDVMANGCQHVYMKWIDKFHQETCCEADSHLKSYTFVINYPWAIPCVPWARKPFCSSNNQPGENKETNVFNLSPISSTDVAGRPRLDTHILARIQTGDPT
jgi:hypothetical protein